MLATVLLGASAASADVVARVEAGAAHPLSTPARLYYGTGFAVGAAAGVDVLPFLELGGRLSYVFVSRNPSSPLASPASLIALGPIVRVHRPRDTSWAPFGELSVQYVRTGPLDRLGFALSLGVHFNLGPISLGPWAGVEQIFRLADTAAYPTRDATVLVGGLSVELALVRSGRDEPPPPPPPHDRPIVEKKPVDLDPDRDGVKSPDDRCPSLVEDRDGWEDDDGCPDADDDGDGVLDLDDACPRVAGTPRTLGCPDRDLDAVADADDHCPWVRGDPIEGGCPTYRELKVGPTRLELARPIDFARGASSVPSQSAAMLDEAARALLDRGVCVRIEGHGDHHGKPNANQALATARAEAVRVHLMSRGLSPSRITAVGLGALAPFADAELLLVPCEVQAP